MISYCPDSQTLYSIPLGKPIKIVAIANNDYDMNQYLAENPGIGVIAQQDGLSFAAATDDLGQGGRPAVTVAALEMLVSNLNKLSKQEAKALLVAATDAHDDLARPASHRPTWGKLAELLHAELARF